MIKKALDFAYEAHKGQKRKGTDVPYMVHIFDVTKYLFYDNVPEEVVVAGILHDTLEDSHTNKDELLQFGKEVIELVEFCSEPGNTVDAKDQKETWKERKLHSIESLDNATRNQALVFLADKLSNISAMREDLLVIEDELWKRFNASKEEIEWYYKSVLEKLNIVDDTRMYKLFKVVVEEVFS